jgi:eukaryotic-like serine/threonine-protein kinase
MTAPADIPFVPPPSERDRVLRLDFECLRTLPGGIHDVRVWWDENLGCERVGKRVDLSGLDDVLPEASTLQGIRHDNVVPIHVAASVGGYPHPMRVIEIVTPYYPLGSLTDALLDNRHLSPTQSIRVVQAALRGVGHLHEVMNIVHRDIKSGNILLTGDQHLAKVADLGCAGRFGPDGTAPALGNPTLYSPPEIVGSGVLTRASDLYAMGLVLLELLRGGFDYESYSTLDIAERLMRGVSPLSPADRVVPLWVSRSLRRVLNKALQSHPTNRYQSASAMDHALSRVSMVDWAEVSEMVWEASFRYHPDRRIRVDATQRKRGGYKLTSRINRGSGWRRYGIDDLEVDDLGSLPVRAFFDQATDTATVR